MQTYPIVTYLTWSFPLFTDIWLILGFPPLGMILLSQEFFIRFLNSQLVAPQNTWMSCALEKPADKIRYPCLYDTWNKPWNKSGNTRVWARCLSFDLWTITSCYNPHPAVYSYRDTSQNHKIKVSSKSIVWPLNFVSPVYFLGRIYRLRHMTSS